MSILQRLQDVLGLNEQFDEMGYADDEYPVGEDDYLYTDAYAHERGYGRRRSPMAPAKMADPGVNQANVVGIPRLPASNPEVILMEPRSFEEIPQAVRALRERKSVVLNLGLMDPDQAQRAADYVAGGAFAIDGHQERLGEHIFLFTPSFVSISSYSAAPPAATTPTTLAAPQPAPSPWSPESFRVSF